MCIAWIVRNVTLTFAVPSANSTKGTVLGEGVQQFMCICCIHMHPSSPIGPTCATRPTSLRTATTCTLECHILNTTWNTSNMKSKLLVRPCMHTFQRRCCVKYFSGSTTPERDANILIGKDTDNDWKILWFEIHSSTCIIIDIYLYIYISYIIYHMSYIKFHIYIYVYVFT